jgi:hypothetical protein
MAGILAHHQIAILLIINILHITAHPSLQQDSVTSFLRVLSIASIFCNI